MPKKDQFDHLVPDKKGKLIEATPTQTPAPTRTIGSLDKALMGDAANIVRRQDGSIDWLKLYELLVAPNAFRSDMKTEKARTQTPTPRRK